MKRSFTCLALLCLTSLTGCSLNFQDFSAPDGSYSVKMPGKPVRSTNVGAGAQGEAWEVLTSRWNFAVATVELPASAAAAIASQPTLALDGGVQGMTSHMRATQKGVSSIDLNGFPGKEVELSLPAGPNPTTGKQEPASSAVVRIYLVNSRIVMLMARCRSTITKDSADVKTFFNSFKLNATASPSVAGGGSSSMAGMPGGAMPPGTAGTTNPAAAYPGMPPSGTDPAGASPPGYPVAGANPGSYPATGSYSAPGSYPAAAGAPAGAYPMPTGTTPMPGAYPMPAGTTPVPGASPMPNGSYPMPAGTGGTTPMGSAPPGAYPAAGAPGTVPPNATTYPSTPGSTPAGGFNNPGAYPNGGVPGQPGNGPTFTGTPVTDETKVAVGDTLQFNVNGNWVDVKVQKVSPNGTIQIRTATRPFQTATVLRSTLQIGPGAGNPEVATKDAPRTDASGLPNSKSAGLPDSSASAKSKPRASGFLKPTDTTASKPEPSKGTALIGLDDASVEVLLKIIAKKTEHRRVLAAERLRDHREAGPNPEVAQKLVELLQADQLTVRNAVAQTLEKWACPEIHAAVLKNLKGGTTEVRQSMMRILAANSVEGDAEGIAQCLIDKDDRKVATEILISLGEPAQGAVIKMLDHRDSKVKLAACDILKEIGTADAITALTKATTDWTGADRLAARRALKALEAKK